MSEITETIRRIPNLFSIKGCSKEQVIEAQDALDLIFPDEFVDYVLEFGCIDFGATEWTGLNITGRLNTVEATNREKSVNPGFPKGCFVLEDLGIDAKKVIVDQRGEVFLLQYDKVTFLCKTILEYLDICVKRNGES